MSRCLRPRHQGSSSPSWSDLPPKLLRAIANRLNPNSDDVQRFRRVCKNWRLATPHPLQLYAVLPRNIYPNYDNSFSSTAVYLLRQRSRSSISTAARNTWLITVEQSNDGTLRLLHLLTGRPVENLPQEFLTNSLFNVDSTREITRTFDLKYSTNNNNNMLNEISVLNDKIPYKVILWPNPKVKSPAGPQDYSYVVFQEGSHPKNNIRCFRTTPENHTTENHRYIAYGLQTRFDDIVHWKGLICAVDSSGKLYGISYKTMNLVTVFVMTRLSYVEHQQCRLAVWKGKMYLVRQRHATITVYELNEKRYLWDELTTLGVLILFVRPDNCFFVQASDLPGCQGNCVVIIPRFDKKKSKAKTITRRASKLFEGAGGYVKVRVYKYGDGGKDFKLIEACPGFANVLWPPPSWITET